MTTQQTAVLYARVPHTTHRLVAELAADTALSMGNVVACLVAIAAGDTNPHTPTIRRALRTRKATS